jgi:hypothetical protein
MVDCETTIIKYDVLQLTDIEHLLHEGHEMKIEYIARGGCWEAMIARINQLKNHLA